MCVCVYWHRSVSRLGRAQEIQLLPGVWFRKYNLEVPLTAGGFQQLGLGVPPESPLLANWSYLALNHPLVANFGNLGWKHL